jgi:uncharacterized protein involved in type VI secretion and phage assembly
VYEETARRSAAKTDSGDNRIFGIVVGQVTDNYDMNNPGRVCVSVPIRDSESNILKWVRVVQPYTGETWGQYFLPEVGDEVMVAFDQGIIDEPYVIGCIPKDKSKFLKDNKHASNIYKRIQTKHGSSIVFIDGMETPTEGVKEEGQNDKISIYTANKQHEITINNEKKFIRISDNNDMAKIEMDTDTGNIEIKCANKLTINVGGSISLVMNATSGNLDIKANNITLESSGKLSLTGGGNTTLKGGAMNISAGGAASISASGSMTITGSPVKV